MIAACLKWVDGRPEIDRLTGAVHDDPRTSGPSEADQAALEWALRLGGDVLAVTAGPPASEDMLRDALACGAAAAVRVDMAVSSASSVVAAALAGVVRDATVVVCGAWSADRGSGSVPAFLAAHLEVAQALGLITLAPTGGAIAAERRLDGGRRERLRLDGRAVLSVEGGSAQLRRAPLDGVLAARSAPIRVVPGPVGHAAAAPVTTAPYRPRARVLPAPTPDLSPRERILALTGALVDRTPAQRLVLDPPAAADRILDAMRDWGYL